jgi:hypothetical protein
MRPHTAVHPLTAFFHYRKFTVSEGMAWLQGIAEMQISENNS